METIVAQLSGILSGDMVSLALKVALLVGVPLVAGIVMWVMSRKAAAEKLAAEQKAADAQEKHDAETVIGGNQTDSGQARTDQEKSEAAKQKLLDELNGKK